MVHMSTLPEPRTNLDLLFVQRDALHNVETRRLVGFRIGVICRLKNGLVLGSEDEMLATAILLEPFKL